MTAFHTPVFNFPVATVRRPIVVTREMRRRCAATDIEAARHTFVHAGPSLRPIIAAAAGFYGVEPWELLIKRRFWSLSRRRAVISAVARARTKLSLHDIGARLGGYDHSTIAHACRRADPVAVVAICAAMDGRVAT